MAIKKQGCQKLKLKAHIKVTCWYFKEKFISVVLNFLMQRQNKIDKYLNIEKEKNLLPLP